MTERDFKGVWIPRDIWLSKELTMVEKGILTEISSLDNEEHCYATNEYFADFCQVSVSTVTRAIKKLIDLGYIEVVTFNGRNRVIKMTSQPSQIDYADSSKCVANNIDNKTDNKNTNTNVLVEKKPKSSKPNLYQKCVNAIQEFTTDISVQQSLTEYLKFRLEVKDKPLYFNQFTAMLAKLRDLTESKQEALDIIKQSVERGYLSFYPLNKSTRSNVKSAACEENVSCATMTEEELEEQNQFVEEMIRAGKQIKF